MSNPSVMTGMNLYYGGNGLYLSTAAKRVIYFMEVSRSGTSG